MEGGIFREAELTSLLDIPGYNGLLFVRPRRAAMINLDVIYASTAVSPMPPISKAPRWKDLAPAPRNLLGSFARTQATSVSLPIHVVQQISHDIIDQAGRFEFIRRHARAKCLVDLIMPGVHQGLDVAVQG